MSLRLEDWKWACIAAVVLTGLAMLLVFGINPGGFESQLAWFVLLPAGLPAYSVSDFFHKTAPHAQHLAFWTSMAGLNFLWYWTISFIVIKIRRALV